MPDYDRLLSQQRNALLNPEFTTRDAIRAGVQSTTGTPYAENRANITAEKYNRALSGYQVLSNERDFEAGQDQQMWLRAQAEADRGDKNFQMLLQLSSAYGASPADSQRLASTVIQRTEAENLDDPSLLPGMIAEEAERMGMPAKTGQTPQIVGAGSTIGGIDPITGQFDPQYTAPALPSGGVTIVNAQEKEYEKQAGGALLEAQQAAIESSATADRLEASINTVESVLQRTETGSLRGALSSVTALGDDLGIDVPAVAGRLGLDLNAPEDAQTIKRLSAGIILERLSELPDARPSDRDLAVIEQSSLGLRKTREDNLRFIEAMRNSVGRIREVSEITRKAETWRDYQDTLAEWREANPVTTTDVIRYITESATGRQAFWDDDLGKYRFSDTGEPVD